MNRLKNENNTADLSELVMFLRLKGRGIFWNLKVVCIGSYIIKGMASRQMKSRYLFVIPLI